MKYLILVVVLLTGCEQYINPAEYDKAVQACSVNTGVSHIRVFGANIKAYCNNGAVFSLGKG